MNIMVSARATEAGIKKRHQITSYAEIPSIKSPAHRTHGQRFVVMPPDRAKTIILQVAERRGVRVVDMVGPLRCKTFVDARYEAIYEIRLTGRYSLPQIGRFFNRDHTSILHAVRAWPAKAAALGIPCVPLNGEGAA